MTHTVKSPNGSIPMRMQFQGRELFMLHQPGAAARQRSHVVLLCNPFGQEAIRAHRFYRVLGDRLAADGFDVLRFDYFGSGDSAGEDEEFDLLGAVSDTVAVANWAMSGTRASHVSLLGLRLGASIARLACARLQRAAAHLILFEPVLDGADYLEQLVSINALALTEIFGSRWKVDPTLRSHNLPRAGVDEALGFALGAQLQQQLREQLPARASWSGNCRHAFVLARSQAACAHWVEQASPGVLELRDADSDVDWATNSAINTSIVPMRWIEQVLDCLRAEQAHA